MTSMEPTVVRLFPFQSEGGALAAVQMAFGPICVSMKLHKAASGGHFLSVPSRKSEARDKWYEQVTINDPVLMKMAVTKAVAELERMERSEAVAV